MTNMTSEERNTVAQWWASNFTNANPVIDRVNAGLSLADLASATGQHEAALGEWLIESGAPENIGGYNRNDPKWDVYFHRAQPADSSFGAQVTGKPGETATDPNGFVVGG